ncbi:hypothetical protein HNO88_000180 [Novosphingobium chloroacetimidivorans]|uniref:DUF4019 domain-containing protein n=1 Tax=Novosphingobium chloroacetimidivorans TaxID=1428314 RepID=A0A7W7NTV3_9SPHN|nr:DUF4019 domain-containing protein [Novosphingobium chloroacetimidivorans]MBB4856883.1 hypothetical protein [Novosphingobium chloroacetimidivorans]
MNRIARYLVPVAGVAMLAGCGVKQGFEDASADVARFHQALDRGDVQRLWDEADPQFRKATPRAQFDRLVAAIRTKLGKVKASKQVGWNANASTSGTFLTVTAQTTFERGTGTEEFVFAKHAGQRPRLAGYDIQSQDMMLD